METPQKRTAITGVNTNISYFRLRKLIGLAGLTLIFTPLFAGEPLSSISHSFYSPAGILFIGTVVLCGTFLMTYKGPQDEDLKIQDDAITSLAGSSILLVAFIPTGVQECPPGTSFPNPPCTLDTSPLTNVHFGGAVMFFALMGFMFVYRFTRGPMKDGKPDFDSGKKVRNVIYRISGIGMWVILAIAGIMIGFKVHKNYHSFIYWVEVPLLIFFGTAWLVKGKALADLGLQEDNDELSNAEVEQLTRNIALEIKTMEQGRKMVSQLKQLSAEAKRQV